jgi:hypothetical protein
MLEEGVILVIMQLSLTVKRSIYLIKLKKIRIPLTIKGYLFN